MPYYRAQALFMAGVIQLYMDWTFSSQQALYWTTILENVERSIA